LEAFPGLTPRRRRRAVRGAVTALLAGVALRGPAGAQPSGEPVPDANPARPTVSTPAALPPVGYIQFETGFLLARGSPEIDTRASLTHTAKLAVSRGLELLVQGEPLTRAGNRTESGEIFLGAQVVPIRSESGAPTIAASYFRQVRETDTPDLDVGSTRQIGILLVSFEAFGFHVDANGYVGEQRQASRSRVQYGESLSVSHPLGRLTVSGELWRFSQPFRQAHAAGTLWAVSYPVRRNLVIDGGVEFGLSRTSTTWEAFAGFTYLLPRRLWRSER
jgi:hypothetical protein